MSQALGFLHDPFPPSLDGDSHHEVSSADGAGPRTGRLGGWHGEAAPRVRDIWHSYVADGKRYGYVHTVVVRLPDGNFRITQETRVLMDLFGINKEELTERGEYVVTADYRPVSISVEGKRESGVARVTGRKARFVVRGNRDDCRHRAEPGVRPARGDPP